MAGLSDETLTEIFGNLDKDNSGKLEKSEIRSLVEKVVSAHGSQLETEEQRAKEVEFLMAKFDISGDGTITVQEFIEAYRQAKR
ncbi:DgyrCDS9765 [Dimorphilus gyrociliatus]|uniref:DgyrCDS9765 n=1 Tax=Dimorphilus gyrociliatus TaxID=2664684 RepID=A0A7I8VZ85_9ANNE|nr:DgyrCDS9765 [Dimorphilus gyrociliatus]